jgi:dynein heavy chain
MNNMPMEIEKLKVDMDKCFEIYAILEEFDHKFSNDEMNKRW